MPLTLALVKTANTDGAGTNADILMKVIGQNYTTEWINLDTPGDSFERGKIDYFVLPTPIPDIPQKILLRVREESATPDRPDWNLEYIKLFPLHSGFGVLDTLLDVEGGQIPQGGLVGTAVNKLLNNLPSPWRFKGTYMIPASFSKRGTAEEWTEVELEKE